MNDNDSELNEVAKRLYKSLFKESGRGAILVATTIVEEQLKELLYSILPIDFSKENKKRLFHYPGPLSSFASKNNIAYAFRLIDQTLYDSLNSLRDIRNDAAHSPKTFELHELNERLRNIYSLTPTLPETIKVLAKQMLLFDKTNSLNIFFEGYNLTDQEKENKISELLSDKKSIELFEKQIPFWELISGLWIICGLLIDNKKKLSFLSTDIRIFSEILSHNMGANMSIEGGAEH